MNKMIRMVSIFIMIVFLLVTVISPLDNIYAMDANTLGNSITTSSNWLKSTQNADGSWGTDASSKFRITTKVVESLSLYGLVPESSGKGITWLKNNIPQNNTDIARYVAISKLAEEVWKNQILNSQAEYGGWGLNNGGPSDNVTTCISASYLLENNIALDKVTKAAYNLLSSQNNDGSWGMVKGANTGNVVITGMVRAFLIKYQSLVRCNMSAELELASKWLLANRLPDGGWGTSEATYMAYMGLKSDKPDLVKNIPDYFLGKQNSNGSWDSDPYQTALVLDLLSKEKLESNVSINNIKLFSGETETVTFASGSTVEIVPVFSGRDAYPLVTVITTDGSRINLTKNAIGGYSWNCEMNKAGTYEAEVVLKDSQGQIKAKSTKNFTIKPIMEISECEIDITPGASLVNKPIKPMLELYVNCSATNVDKPVDVKCSVLSPEGNEIYSKQASSVLKIGDNNIPLGSFSPVITAKAEYTVKTVLSYDGKEVCQRSEYFHILDQIDSTYTTNSDFDRGTLKGVNHDEVKDQLQLNKYAEVFPYIWIANAAESTVSKIDTRTGKEVGRYATGVAGNPSRTAVDKDGNCWVGNRAIGTVVKIAMTGGIDKNGNGKIDTSSDLNGNGVIDSNEILPWGQDEAILANTSVGNSSNCIPRALAIDKKGQIWVGLYNEKRFVVLNPNDGKFTGISVNVNSTPYGATIDKDGYLWTSGNGSGNVIDKIDTNNNTYLATYDIGAGPYGIVVDKQGIVWVASYTQSVLVRFDPATNTYTHHKGNGVTGRGVGVDRDGNVWVAYSGNNWVDKFDSTGKYLASTNLASYGGTGPIGIGVDSEGYIWATCQTSNNTVKIDSSGKVVGVYKVGNGPYTYSDMTGFNLQNITAHEGTWTVTYDGGKEECTWSKVSWSANEPDKTGIKVRVKGANQVEELASKPFTDITNGVPFVNVSGRFLMVEAKLSTASSQSPQLTELKIEGKEGVLLADAGDDITVQAAQGELSANVTLDGSGSIDPDGNKLTYKWSWTNGNAICTAEGVQPTINLPIGTTEVKLIVNNGFRDSVADTVLVSVVENNLPLEIPQVPQDFKAQVDSGTQVSLSWSPSQYASYYELEIDGQIVNNKDNTSYVHTGLTPGSTHQYKVRAVNSKGTSEWSELLTVSVTNYADEIDRILKKVEEMLPNLKDTDIIQKAQELLNSAIKLMPNVSAGSVKDSLTARIQKAQDAIDVAKIDVNLTILENMLPNISTLEPIKASLEQVQVDVNRLPVRLDKSKKDFQIRIDAIFKRFSNSWYTKPFMQSAKSKAAVIYSDEKIYAIGGIVSANVYSDEIEMFDTNINKWVVLTKMPGGARQGMVAASVDGKIYIIGGKQGSTNLKTVEVYNTNTNTWEENGTNMPTARQGAVCAVIDGKIYVIGGSSSSTYFNKVEVYDPATNTWSTKKSMTIARDTAGVAVVDNKIYVVGGKGKSTYLNNVEVYDPAQDIWETKAPMNTERRALGVCQVNGLIYAIGGLNATGDLGKVEVYNPSTNEWQEKTEMTMKRSYLSAVSVNGSLYGIGGTFNGEPVNTVEEFIP